jgi:hypothetical protein
MADEPYGPKPDPGARMVSWPVLIWLRAWCWLAWPWQVRQMKAAGFRRVGWMTWETGPELRAAITQDILTLPPEYGDGQLCVRGPLDGDWEHIGTTDPGFDWSAPRLWTPAGADVRYADGDPDIKLRSCQGISPEMAAELAEGVRRLADPEER